MKTVVGTLFGPQTDNGGVRGRKDNPRALQNDSVGVAQAQKGRKGMDHAAIKAKSGPERRMRRIKAALAAMPEKRRLKIEKRAKDCPPSMRTQYLELACGIGTKSVAIKAFCRECVGYDRASVTDCTALACALWPFRPYQE